MFTKYFANHSLQTLKLHSIPPHILGDRQPYLLSIQEMILHLSSLTVRKFVIYVCKNLHFLKVILPIYSLTNFLDREIFPIFQRLCQHWEPLGIQVWSVWQSPWYLASSFVVHFDYFFIYYLKCVIGSEEGIELAEYIGSNPRLRKLVANVFFLFHAHAKASTQIAIYVVQ